MRRTAVFIATALVAAACSGDGDPVAATTTIAPPSTTTTTIAPPDPGRIAVVSGTEAVIVAPDGSGATAVGGSDTVAQPVWSPDGGTLAWAYTGDTDAGVATDGGLRVDLGRAPFYLSWAPDGSRIAYLMPAPSGIEFGLIDAATGDVDHRDEGQPYYFSWAPDGSGMLRHIGDELIETGLDPRGDPIAEPGIFQAPAWVGRRQVFAAVGGSGAGIVVRNTATGERDEIAEFDGFALFSMSPDGARVAWVAVGETGPAVAALQSSAQAGAPALKVHDLGRGTTATLEPAVAFFWDRTGSRLLYLTTAENALQWHVWGADGTRDLDVFRPSATFAREYLPFFDQYAQSHRFWNRDGNAFVFAGTVGSQTGIWVRSLDEARARLLTEGDFAVWS